MRGQSKTITSLLVVNLLLVAGVVGLLAVQYKSQARTNELLKRLATNTAPPNYTALQKSFDASIVADVAKATAQLGIGKPNILEEPGVEDGEFKRVDGTLLRTSFNIVKTESLTSPFIGTVTLSARTTQRSFATEKEAKTEESTPFNDSEVTLTFAYQSGQWNCKSAVATGDALEFFDVTPFGGIAPFD